MRATSLVLWVLVSGAMLVSAPPARGQQQRGRSRPNIVFIISDDHRWDALGAAGNAQIKTPVLDRLAREGVYFRQATIHVSQCAPSRATLLTGLPPHQSGYYANNFLRTDLQWADRFKVPTVPGLLQQAGYRTVLVGKWHLGTDPWLTGFSDVRTWLPEGASSYTDSRLARGNSRNRERINGFTNGVFADDAIEFLSSPAAKERPFLLWLASTLPHSPYQPNPSHIEHMYEQEEAAEDMRPPNFPPHTPVKLGLEGSPEGTAEPGLVKYYESVSYLDELVGRLLATLEKQGLAEDTVVVFLGDNGLMAGSRGVRGKVVPWEESVRVPLIIRAPRFAAVKGRSDAAASSLDIPATLLALAGVAPPKEWAGRDLRPVLRGAKHHGIEHAFGEWADTESQFRHYTHRLIRTPRYKLIRWDKPDKPDELYDLVADPHEKTNVIDRPAVRSVRAGLLRRLHAWMERTQDPARFWPRKNGRTQDQAAEAGAEAELRAGLDDKTPAEVDPRLFDAYAGRYEFVTRLAVSISKEGDKLFFQGEFGGKSELIPKSENVFLHRRLPMRFTFVKDERGRVTHLVRRNSLSPDVRTIDMKARKIE